MQKVKKDEAKAPSNFEIITKKLEEEKTFFTQNRF